MESIDNLGRARTQYLHTFSLWGFAVAYPIYELVLQRPGFLLIYHSSPAELISSYLVLSLGIPVLLALFIGIPAGLLPGRKAKAFPLLCMIFPLFSMIFMQYARQAGILSGAGQLGTSATAGFLVTLLYAKSSGLQKFVSALALASVFFPVYYATLTLHGINAWERSSFSEGNNQKQMSVAAKNKSVVFVIFDELSLPSLLNPDYQIDAELFPGFARLASQSTWYRNASTTAESTNSSVSAILSGKLPRPSTNLPIRRNYPDNLFSLLAKKDFEIFAEEFNTFLCPSEVNNWAKKSGLTFTQRVALLFSDLLVVGSHALTPQEYSRFLPEVRGVTPPFFPLFKVQENADERRLLKKFSSLKSNQNSSLYYMHFLLPHHPYNKYSSGTEYAPHQQNFTWDANSEMWPDDSMMPLYMEQRYMLQAQYLDRTLEMLLDILERRQDFQDTLLVVLADHGVSFIPGFSMRFTDVLQQKKFTNLRQAIDIVKVPLFIKYPGQREGKINDEHVLTIDAVPTVLDSLEMEVNDDFDGISLLEERKHEKFLLLSDRNQHKSFVPHDLSIFDARFVLERKYRELDISGHFSPALPEIDRLQLVGRQVSEFTQTKSSLIVSVYPPALKPTDPPSMLVRGLLDGGGSHIIALAIDGVIAEVGHSYSNMDGEEVFSILPAESWRPPSEKEFSLYEVEVAGSEAIILKKINYNSL